MLELKSKNAMDHSNRLDERLEESKTEFSNLRERYTELLKTHMDYMERTKFLLGSDKYDAIQNLPVPSTTGPARPS